MAALDPALVALGQKSVRLQTQLATEPNNLTKRWDLADTYQKMAQPDLAEQQLKIIARQDPNSLEARLGLANIQLARGNLNRAEQEFRDVVRRFPRKRAVLDAWAGLAAISYHQGRYIEAERAARQGLRYERESANLIFIRSSAIVELAANHPRPQIYEEAVRLALIGLHTILSAWPEKGAVYYKIGRAHVLLKDSRNALKYLRRAKELLPDRPEVDIHLAKVLSSTGKRPQAIELIEESVKKHPNHAGLHDVLGQLLMYSSDPNHTRRMYEEFGKACQLRPQQADYWQRFGTACITLDKIDEAKQAFEEAVRLDPNVAYPFQQLAKIHRRQGEPEKAARYAEAASALAFNEQQLQQIESMLQLNPSGPRAIQLHLILAERYRQLGWLYVAHNEYSFVLRKDPQNKRAKEGLRLVENTKPGPQITEASR